MATTSASGSQGAPVAESFEPPLRSYLCRTSSLRLRSPRRTRKKPRLPGTRPQRRLRRHTPTAGKSALRARVLSSFGLPPTNQVGLDVADPVVDSLPRQHRSLQHPQHREQLGEEQPEEHGISNPQCEAGDPNNTPPAAQAQDQQRREASARGEGVLPPDSTEGVVEAAAAAAQVLRIGKITTTRQIRSGVCRPTTSLMGTWSTVGAAASWTRPSKSG